MKNLNAENIKLYFLIIKDQFISKKIILLFLNDVLFKFNFYLFKDLNNLDWSKDVLLNKN